MGEKPRQTVEACAICGAPTGLRFTLAPRYKKYPVCRSCLMGMPLSEIEDRLRKAKP